MKSDGDQDGHDVLHHFRDCSFSAGELTRVRQLVDGHGKSLILPYDQFVEHDVRHLDGEGDGGNPRSILALALQGRYTGLTVHYGIAKRYWSQLDGALPLVLKVNGKTAFPTEEQAFSTLTGAVEDSVRLGAAGIGYTMYYGSPRQDDDIAQLSEVRRECDRYGMPLIVWAYPRGEAVDYKGGPKTSYSVESATRMAMEMGATIIKSDLPVPAKPSFLDNGDVPAHCRDVEKELQELSPEESLQIRADRVVQAAQGVPVLFSGGSQISDEDLFSRAEVCIKAGALGFIFGRNMWKRERGKALEITEKLRALLHETA